MVWQIACDAFFCLFGHLIFPTVCETGNDRKILGRCGPTDSKEFALIK